MKPAAGPVLVSVFVFASLFLVASAAHIGTPSENSIKVLPSGCRLPEIFPSGFFSLDYDDGLEEDENGVSWVSTGTEIKFQCNHDYLLVGPSVVLCMGNNKWESPFPKCRILPSGCQLPEIFPRGSFGLDYDDQFEEDDDGVSWVSKGSEVKFQCDFDYVLLGPSVVLCIGNNKWESSFPKCRKRYCDAPPDIEGGYWRATRRSLSSYARLRCNGGYVLEDPKVRSVKCVEVNETELDWSGNWPACRKLAECPDPGSPATGTGIRIGQVKPFYEGAVLSFRCEDEFVMVGEETINCLNDSTWDFPRARCKPNITCEDLPEDDHRILKVDPTPRASDFFVPGDMLELTCVPGFSPDHNLGSSLIFCESDGLWDEDLTVCIETVCSPPGLPKNGYLLNGNEDLKYKPGTEIKYRCQPGHRLFGYNWNRCTDMGWKNEPPRCEEVTCSDPGSPENGKQHGSSPTYKVNSTIVFSCFDGYKLIGSSERKCMSNGQWDGTLAICTPRKADGCPSPGIPTNGFRRSQQSSTFQPGDTVHFGCNPDFTLDGSANRTCQEDGRWDGQEAQCRGRYDVDRPQEVKFRLLDELDTELTLQDTQQQKDPPGSAMSGRMLDTSIRNTGGHLFFYFIFDSSDSVGNDNFQTSIKFATALIKRVGVSDNVHVGLVTYGSTAKTVLSPFGNTMDIVMRKLANITYLGGGTATKAAIKLVRDMVVHSSRRYPPPTRIQSVVFLVTDGLHNVGGNPEEEAKILKDMGVEIFVVGLVGHKNINRNSMIHLASPGGKHVFYTDGYETMEYLVDELLTDSVDYSHCGISVRDIDENAANGRIHGGESAIIHWPWMVHLNIRTTNDKKQVVNATCGGSIIENSWVLSAAHCFNGIHIDNVTLTAGVLNLAEENDGDRQIRSIERTWIHPKYNGSNYDYDVALVKLKTPLQYGKFIRRICLPPHFNEIEKSSILYREKEVAYVIGFGRTQDGVVSSELKEVDVLIQNKDTCTRSIRNHDAVMTEQMICAGHPEGEKDACDGDSGGPLMQEVNGGSRVKEPYWVQVGVVSWGIKDKCGAEGYYGFYTHLAKLKKDVVQEMKTH